MLGATAQSWLGFPIQRYQAPPNQRYRSEKRQQRAGQGPREEAGLAVGSGFTVLLTYRGLQTIKNSRIIRIRYLD